MTTANAVTWNYTALAQPYLKRPDYAQDGLEAMLAKMHLASTASVCDVGAGIGHLTIPLARRGFNMTAVEPNDAMRALGAQRTRDLPNVVWRTGTGEDTGLPAGSFDLVTFGSSFNVTDRPKALAETRRILRPGGWFACLWNHRDLDDPLQREVESVIRGFIPDYDYGSRREDQEPIIAASGLFNPCQRIEAPVLHRVALADWVEAWRSHATLARQAGGRLPEIVAAIEAHLIHNGHAPDLTIPYVTRIWFAQAKV